MSSGSDRVTAALEAAGVEYRLTRHGRVNSLAEAAAARGVSPGDIVKTMVVRRGEDDYVLTLVPGDRQIAWPKLRELLGVNRLSMPDADTALAATGFARGTITPFGTTRSWPVVADADIVGRTISLGAGEHGAAVTVSGDQVIQALDAVVADITTA